VGEVDVPVDVSIGIDVPVDVDEPDGTVGTTTSPLGSSY
jgi:hypothetical protein